MDGSGIKLRSLMMRLQPLLCRWWLFHTSCLHASSSISFYTQYQNHSTCPFQVRGKLFPFREIFFWQRKWRGGSQLSCHQPLHSPLFQKGALAFIVTKGDDWLEKEARFSGWNPKPSEIHLVSCCITNGNLDQVPWRLAKSSWTPLTNPDCPSNRFQPVFTPTRAKFHTIQGPVSISGGKRQKWILLSPGFYFVLREFGFNS